MVQKNRSKEVWLIPKRGSLHQTICIIEAIINQKLDAKTWNESKQNNVGNALRKRGAVRRPQTISNQSVRTLVASMPQYFGFLYIDNSTTPSTIRLTEAGELLYDAHKSQITNIVTLGEGKRTGDLIESSDVFLRQFEKLQITNPIILKDCENIMVFPLRLVLRLLLELDYLDREELAYLVFSIRDESEIPLFIKKILRFRQQNFVDREDEINEFRRTHIGQITLVKASSASYFESMCANTGIINKVNVKVPNPGNDNKNLSAISIKTDEISYVKEILDVKYKDAIAFDFEDNRELWIEYIGNPKRLSPPREVVIKNEGQIGTIVLIKQNGQLLVGDLLDQNKELSLPLFLDEKYEISCLDTENGYEVLNKKITPTISDLYFTFDLGKKSKVKYTITKEVLKHEILEHSSSKKFSPDYSNYLGIIESITGWNLLNNSNLRGARYEYLFYLLLEELKKDGIIDDIYWNGKIREFGLPVPAPGGKLGEPDIVFTIGDDYFILELTTIREKSTQWSAEGSSVPDHLKVFYQKNGIKPTGIYTAPIMHDRVVSGIKSNLVSDEININCIEDVKLLDILLSSNKQFIKEELTKYNV
jgi:hypothetical protein